jgi:hypothetical protein
VTRDERARAGRAALLVGLLGAVAGAGALVLLVERPGRVGSAGASEHAPERMPARAQPRAPSLHASPEPERVLVTPERAPAAPIGDPDPARIEPALAELAALLEAPRTTRVQWERAVRATAGSLSGVHAPGLLAAAADPARAESVRVAAAELLRVRDEESGSLALPGPALHALRTAAASAEPFPMRCAAACRALAWFGDAGDRLALVQALGDPAAGPRAELAAHGLQGTRSTDVVPDLVALATRGTDADVARRALVTLERMGAMALRTEWWPESLRAEVGAALAAGTVGLEPGSELRLRALALMEAFRGPEAEALLLAELQATPGAETARVAAGLIDDPRDPRVRGELAALLAEDALPAENRLAVAETLLRTADEPHGSETEAARLWLRNVALGDGSPAARRRAVAALAGLRDPADRGWLAELARSEEALALHALVPPELDSALNER